MTNKEKLLDNIKEEVKNCTNCSLYKMRTNTVFSDGCAEASIFFIGEAPGKNEDETGLPFVGRAGKLLRSYLDECGYKKEDFYIANTIKCRPPENRKPKPFEKEACRHFLEKQLELVNPKIIVLVGSTALASYCDDKKLTITKARGKIFQKDGKKFFPIFHPSYLLRYHSISKGSPRYLFKQDLLNILKEAAVSN